MIEQMEATSAIVCFSTDPKALSYVWFTFGYIVHCLHKCARDGINVIEYWKSFPINSGLSVAGAFGSYTALGTMDYSDPILFFIAGYSIDSFFNKAGVERDEV